MIKIFYTPLPLVLAAICYSLLSLPKISKKCLAKIGRIISVFIFLFNVVFLLDAMNNKVVAGQHGLHARKVLQFTNYVEQLLIDGNCLEAKKLLNQFNKEYQYAGNIDEIEELILKLIGEANKTSEQFIPPDLSGLSVAVRPLVSGPKGR